jgi:Cu2+-exporting ATPase/Cu+-exporting ATPase
MSKKIFSISGMHCASCATIIKKKIQKLPGVNNVEVNFATEKAQIEGDFDLSVANNEINKLGYKLEAMEDVSSVNHSEHLGLNQKKEQKEKELLEQQVKTHFVLPLALVIFVIMIWDILARTFYFVPNFPIPMQLFNIISMILASIVLFWVGKPFILGVIRFFKYRVANMDTLIGIGTISAYLYSTIIVLLPQIRDFIQVPDYTYFDVVIVVIGFVTFGKYLEANSKKRTGDAIEKLLNLQAKTALVFREGKEIEISIDEVLVGDIVIVKPGSKIPVDGKIIEGKTSIDESMITGESIPVDKKEGDLVIGSTINKQGSFKFEVTKVGQATMLAQIIKMVEEAQGSKAPIQDLADKVSSVFVPTVLALASLSFILWISVGSFYLGQSTAISYAILSFVGILVIACPCALGLATPTAIIVGVGKGAERGILIKDASSLEILNKVTLVAFDKTGTITKGKPEVTDVLVVNKKFTENDILKFAGSVEKKSEHPLGEAIVSLALERNISLLSTKDFVALEGVGVKAFVDEKEIYVHKPEKTENNSNLKSLEGEGKTVVWVEINNEKIGLIALSDVVKDTAKEAIKKIHSKGIKVVMITGDNHLTANYIAKQVGIDSVISGVLPNEKSLKIKELQDSGYVVAMAGDGVNDAPALMMADVGIAMSTGTDVAIESAGVTLLAGDILKISEVITLSRATIKTVKQNLFWAFVYNVIGIPIAGGALYPIWGIVLNPIFAGLAMAFSSVSVVFNSLRLKTKKL